MTEVEKQQAQSDLDHACENMGSVVAEFPVKSHQLQAAYDEVRRERGMRERCFPNWVHQGRLSSTDAKDRLDRIIFAEKVLAWVIDRKGPDPS